MQELNRVNVHLCILYIYVSYIYMNIDTYISLSARIRAKFSFMYRCETLGEFRTYRYIYTYIYIHI